MFLALQCITYVWTDYFLVDSKLLPNTQNVKYHTITISFSFTVHLEDNTAKHERRRLNPTLSTDPLFCSTLKTDIKAFYENNESPDVSPLLLQDTLRAFLRGHIISNEAFRNKVNKERLKHLEQQMKSWIKTMLKNPSRESHRMILLLKYEYNKILTYKSTKSFSCVNKNIF